MTSVETTVSGFVAFKSVLVQVPNPDLGKRVVKTDKIL